MFKITGILKADTPRGYSSLSPHALNDGGKSGMSLKKNLIILDFENIITQAVTNIILK